MTTITAINNHLHWTATTVAAVDATETTAQTSNTIYGCVKEAYYHQHGAAQHQQQTSEWMQRYNNIKYKTRPSARQPPPAPPSLSLWCPIKITALLLLRIDCNSCDLLLYDQRATVSANKRWMRRRRWKKRISPIDIDEEKLLLLSFWTHGYAYDLPRTTKWKKVPMSIYLNIYQREGGLNYRKYVNQFN